LQKALQPSQPSSEYGPGPFNGSAIAPAPYINGSSMPLDAAKMPCPQWTLNAATIITDSISAGPTGPPNPSATSTPLIVSPSAAAVAKRRPGRKPICSKNAPVPLNPYPPNQPNSFCAPCPAISVPSTTRRKRTPTDMSNLLNMRSDYNMYSYYLSIRRLDSP